MGVENCVPKNRHLNLLNRVPTCFLARYPRDTHTAEWWPEDLGYNRYEGQPMLIYSQLVDTMLRNSPTSSGFYDKGITRTEVLLFYMNFTDLSKPDDYSQGMIESAFIATKIIQRMENLHEKTGRRVSLSEQLAIALELTEGNVPIALTSLAMGTRQASNGVDNHIFENAETEPHLYLFGKRRMWEWKNIPTGFSFEGSNSATKDTYHFWESAMAGYVREECAHTKDTSEKFPSKTYLSDVLYTLTAKATQVRYLVCGDEGGVHEPAQKLGYKIGRKLYQEHMDYLNQTSIE